MQPGVQDRFNAFIAEKGLRKTVQRDAIIAAAFSTTEHYTAENLLGMARKIEPTVSRATVYRTLPLLVECGVLKEMDFGKDHKFYDPNYNEHPHHNHLICVDCNKIFEISAPFMEWYGSTVSSKLGLSPVSQRLQVSARCNTLRDSGSCPKKA